MKVHYSLILFIFVTNVLGMEPEIGPEPSSPMNDVHFNHGNRDSIFYVYKSAIDKMDPGSRITINCFIVTDVLLKALYEAASRGCKVTVIADARRKENKAMQPKFQNAGIEFQLFNEHGNITDDKHRIINLHNKLMLLEGTIGGKPYEKILGGSPNLSGGGLWHNRECLFTSKESEVVKDAKKSIKSIIKFDRQGEKRKAALITGDASPLHDTPKKTKLCSSLDYDLIGLMEQRLNKAEAGEKIHALGMTFNDQRIFDGFESALKRGASVDIVCNGRSINARNYQQFFNLTRQGADVSAYHPQKKTKIVPLQHVKSLLCEKVNGNVKIVMSSANFTEETKSQLNDAIVIPNDRNLYQKMLDEFNLLKQVSSPFESYVNKVAKNLFA